RMRKLILKDSAGRVFLLQRRQAIRGNRRRVQERHRTSVRLAFVVRELQQIERALDVDLVRGDRRKLRACGQQRGEVKNQVNFGLGEDALERGLVENRSGDFALNLSLERRLERRDVERDDRPCAVGSQPLDEAVANFAVSARNENNRFAHQQM